MSNATTKAGPILAAVMKQLSNQKYQKEFLELVMPASWLPRPDDDLGAVAHWKLIVAQTLGLDTKALLKANEVKPVAPSGMQFKRSVEMQKTEPPSPNLAYFSSLVKAIASGIEPSLPVPKKASEMHEAILAHAGSPKVTLQSLIDYCWSRNIAVVHVNKLPMTKKGLDALVYRYDGRYVIIVARQFAPELASAAMFTIAHELGHIAMGHVEENEALIDDPGTAGKLEAFEPAADTFASVVLSGGRYDPNWCDGVTSPIGIAKLAEARGRTLGIDPGHMLLRWGIENKCYPMAMKSLYKLPATIKTGVHEFVNRIAHQHIQTEPIDQDTQELLSRSLAA